VSGSLDVAESIQAAASTSSQEQQMKRRRRRELPLQVAVSQLIDTSILDFEALGRKRRGVELDLTFFNSFLEKLGLTVVNYGAVELL